MGLQGRPTICYLLPRRSSRGFFFGAALRNLPPRWRSEGKCVAQREVGLHTGDSIVGAWKRFIIRALVLIAAGATIGIICNLFHPDGIPLFFKHEQVLAETVESIDLNGAKRMFDEGSALFVDSRTVREFDEGHVPGARSLPTDEFDRYRERFEAQVPLDRALITYCSGEDCMSSPELAERLADQGYFEVYVFFGGWPAWLAAGYPTAGGWD